MEFSSAKVLLFDVFGDVLEEKLAVGVVELVNVIFLCIKQPRISFKKTNQ